MFKSSEQLQKEYAELIEKELEAHRKKAMEGLEKKLKEPLELFAGLSFVAIVISLYTLIYAAFNNYKANQTLKKNKETIERLQIRLDRVFLP